MTGAVVIIQDDHNAIENRCDVFVIDAYRHGAVAAICGTSLRTLGSSYSYFDLSTPFETAELITVDTYSVLFPNLTKLIGFNVVVSSVEGNQWLTTFTPPILDAFRGVYISVFSVLDIVALLVLVYSATDVTKKKPVIVHASVLVVATTLCIIGTIDYLGRMILFGYYTQSIFTNIGILFTFCNLWLYLFTLWETMDKSLHVSGFVRYRTFFIIASVFTPLSDFILARISEAGPANSILSIVRICNIGVQMFICSAFYIVVIVRLRRFVKGLNGGLANDDQRKKKCQRIINTCTSITIMIITRTCYAFISIVMFSSPLTVLIHMWLERAFAVYTIFVLLYPLAVSSLEQYRSRSGSSGNPMTPTDTKNLSASGTQKTNDGFSNKSEV